jgi:putative cardiolipin synthase
MNAAGSNFVDIDTFVAGPLVRDLSHAFDVYWNSEVVFPVQSIARSDATRAQLQQTFEHRTGDAVPPQAAEIPVDGIPRNPGYREPRSLPLELVPMLNLPFELAAGQLSPLLWEKARVVFDPVFKTEGLNEEEDSIKGTVTGAVIA